MYKFKSTRNNPKLKRTDLKSELLWLKNMSNRSKSTSHELNLMICRLHRALKTVGRTRPAIRLTHPWLLLDRSRTYPCHGLPVTGSG